MNRRNFLSREYDASVPPSPGIGGALPGSSQALGSQQTPCPPPHSIPQTHTAWPICSLLLPAPEKACSKVKGLVAN